MVRKKAHGCAVGFLAFSPVSRLPHILSAAQRFSPVLFYYNYVYII